jgi:acyl carrier protein
MSQSVLEIAAKIFNVPVDFLDSSLTPDEIDTWDSLNHMRLITAIEVELGVRLTMGQIQEVQTLGDFEKLVAPTRSK